MVNILKELKGIEKFDGVRDIKVKVVGNKDVDINIKVTDKEYRIPVLVKLERKVYGMINLGIQGIKSIENGVSILDVSENTYKIQISEGWDDGRIKK